MHKRTDFPSLLWLLIRSSPIWLLCMFLCACAAYGFSAYVLTPSYTSSATLYIYNSQDTARELNAGNVDTSRKLVDTCAVILQSDRTLEQVLRRTGGKQSLEELRGMLTLDSVDHTEILRISVTSKDLLSCVIHSWLVHRRKFCGYSKRAMTRWSIPRLCRRNPLPRTLQSTPY